MIYTVDPSASNRFLYKNKHSMRKQTYFSLPVWWSRSFERRVVDICRLAQPAAYVDFSVTCHVSTASLEEQCHCTALLDYRPEHDSCLETRSFKRALHIGRL